MPGSGDSIQALKAGVMEIPDVIVRQQGRPPARRHDGPRGHGGAGARARARLEGAGGADRGDEGGGDRRARSRRIDAHGEHIEADGDARRAPGAQPARRGARASPRRGCAASSRSAPSGDPEWAELLDRVVRREIDPATAARELLERRTGRLKPSRRRPQATRRSAAEAPVPRRR